jgi:TatD DNase family protein
MPNYIDIHTHSIKSKNKSIRVLDPREVLKTPQSYFCFGIHPWFIDEINYKSYCDKRDIAANSQFFFGLGEIGLDINSKTSFNTQLEIFESEIEFATNRNLNIIVHIVGAFNDFIRIIKKSKFKNNILIHGYSGNEQILNQLLGLKTYFSYGHRMITSKKLQASLMKTPKERLFFETDDQDSYSIEQIYEFGSKILNIQSEELISQIEGNFKDFSTNDT